MCFIPEHTAFLTQKLKQALTDRLPCLWVKLDGSLLPWKEFPTRLSPKLGDGVLDRPWEQVGTVHSLRNNWVPCYREKWRIFNWFFVHRSGFISAIFGWPKGWICDTGWHFHGPPLPTGSSWLGDPPPVAHGVYIWHREDSSKAGHRSHRSLIALSGPDVHLIEMYSLVFVYHSRLL